MAWGSYFWFKNGSPDHFEKIEVSGVLTSLGWCSKRIFTRRQPPVHVATHPESETQLGTYYISQIARDQKSCMPNLFHVCVALFFVP